MLLNALGGKLLVDKDTMQRMTKILAMQKLTRLESNLTEAMEKGRTSEAQNIQLQINSLSSVTNSGENDLVSRYFEKVENGEVPPEQVNDIKQLLISNKPEAYLNNLVYAIQNDPDLSPEEKEEKIAALKSIPFSTGPGILDIILGVAAGIGSEIVLGGVLAKCSHIAD